MTHPFTYQELFHGLRVFFPEEEAHELAKQAVTAATRQSGTSVRPRESIDFSQDLLIVMSLLSDETRDKVEQWRRWDGHEPTPEEQADWSRRREELIGWARDGYGRLPDG